MTIKRQKLIHFFCEHQISQIAGHPVLFSEALYRWGQYSIIHNIEINLITTKS